MCCLWKKKPMNGNDSTKEEWGLGHLFINIGEAKTGKRLAVNLRTCTRRASEEGSENGCAVVSRKQFHLSPLMQ